jgi:hypothetical protein
VEPFSSVDEVAVEEVDSALCRLALRLAFPRSTRIRDIGGSLGEESVKSKTARLSFSSLAAPSSAHLSGLSGLAIAVSASETGSVDTGFSFVAAGAVTGDVA